MVYMRLPCGKNARTLTAYQSLVNMRHMIKARFPVCPS